MGSGGFSVECVDEPGLLGRGWCACTARPERRCAALLRFYLLVLTDACCFTRAHCSIPAWCHRTIFSTMRCCWAP